jgi:4-amino-4-deoxy-L-arabinose transferase-like glycosyltransferase
MSRGALLLLVCVLTMLVGLGRTAIVDSDEAFYAGAGREMVADGDWITPHYNGQPRLNKPILFYWLVAGTFKAIGVSELAARLWAALSGIGLAVVAFLVGRRWIGGGAGLLAGAIVATSVGVVVLVRQSLPDIPLALFISLTIWAAIEALSTRPVATVTTVGSPAPIPQRRWWLAVAAAAMALGLLTKGPIAVAIPAVAVVPLLVWEWFSRGGGTRAPFRIDWAGALIAFAVFVLIAAPWYVTVTRVHGMQFLHEFFIGENVARFASDRFNDRREPWFYLGVMAGGLLPWTAFGVLWAGPIRDLLARRRDVSPVGARLVAWAAGPMILLSASVGSQPRYILPCLVPIAVLLARSIWAHAADPAPGRRDRLFTGATVTAGLTLLAFGLLLFRAKPVLVAVNPSWSPIGAGVMVAAGVVIAAVALLAPRRAVPAVVVAGAAVTVMAFDVTVLRTTRPEPVEIIASAIRAQEPPDAVAVSGVFVRNLTFYTHTPVWVGEYAENLAEILAQHGHVLAVTDSERLARVESSMQRRFPRLAEVTYLNPGFWQRPGAALLNPSRYLQQVVLVSNR